jgi:hypothetical protein
MPDWMPASATDIRERHNIDSNQTFVAFTVPSGFELPDSCRPVRLDFNPGSTEWWPDDAHFKTLPTFQCPEVTTFATGRTANTFTVAAVERPTGRIYFWRAGS